MVWWVYKTKMQKAKKQMSIKNCETQIIYHKLITPKACVKEGMKDGVVNWLSDEYELKLKLTN